MQGLLQSISAQCSPEQRASNLRARRQRDDYRHFSVKFSAYCVNRLPVSGKTWAVSRKGVPACDGAAASRIRSSHR